LSLSVIPHQVLEGSVTRQTFAIFRDITFTMSEDGFDGFIVPMLIVGNKILPIPFLFIGYDFGKFINFKLLVFGRMGIIESPLLERNIFADKVDQPAIHLIKVLN
jgi:hypothetical protein